MNSWFETVKQSLIKQERGCVEYRLAAWQEAINTCTRNILHNLFRTNNIKLQPFTNTMSDSDMNHILSLAPRWSGLNTNLMERGNTLTFKQYENKSKNWLNGSRARHYSHTLYRVMITMAERYGLQISDQLFKNTLQSDKCSILFFTICMCSYLCALFSLKVRVSKASRRVFLLCENSITTGARNNNPTNALLRKYAVNHKYVNRFPLHRQDAIDYFRNESERNVKALLVVIQENKLHTDDIFGIVRFVRGYCKTNDGSRVIMSQKVLNVMCNTIQCMNQSQMEREATIHQLQQRIQELQTSIRLCSVPPMHVHSVESTPFPPSPNINNNNNHRKNCNGIELNELLPLQMDHDFMELDMNSMHDDNVVYNII